MKVGGKMNKKYELRIQLNQIYEPLDKKCNEIIEAIPYRLFECKAGFYNGHFKKNADGQWNMSYYPLPVVMVKKYCEIEINIENIIISTKHRKEQILNYNHNKLNQYPYEIYGWKNLFHQYFCEGIPVEEAFQKIQASDEEEFGYSFVLPFDTDVNEIVEFIKFLREEEFYC